jgi:energy-coupling factor transporter ATP-binding protein EcfA2
MAQEIDKPMRFIADKEIDLRKSDLFDSLHYSSTLVDTIKNSPTEPFTIGVFGEWGSGKSSIVRTAQGILEEEKGKKYHFFTYDAWKYSKDSFRRTFLLKLAESLGLKGNDLFRSFYESKTETLPIKRVPNYGLITVATLMLIGIPLLSFFGPSDIDWSWKLQTILMVVAIGISIVTNLSKEYVGTRQNAILFSPEQFEACFDEMLSLVMTKKSFPERVLGWFKGEGYKSNIDHLVIVLDNIDRCERKIAYELLSDFKNFLGKEQVIFVIPVDDSALRSHVASINDSTSQEADEFLRKIFNNTLKIKPYKTHDLYDFTEQLSTRYELNLEPNTIDVIAKEYATNPRRIIQFLNSLISEKNYLSRRMGDEFVSRYETLIALILLIREEWPALYQLLSDAPYKLRDLQQSLALMSGDTSQEIFLRKTHPHTVKVDDKALKVIFTNQDQHPHISDALINALAARDGKTVGEFVNSSSEGARYLVDYLIEELNHAVGRGVISSLASTFNELTFLNSITPLTESMNIRILGELSRDENIYQCIENFDSAEHLARYINTLDDQGLRNPQEKLLDYLARLVELDSDNGPQTPALLATKWSQLVLSLATHCTSIQILSRLRKPFFITFRDDEFYIESLKLAGDNLKAIVGEPLIDLVIHRYEFTNEHRHAELLYLIKNGVITLENAQIWINAFLASNGDFSTMSKEDSLYQLKLVIDVISTGKFKLGEDILTQLSERIFNPRVRVLAGQPRTNISLLSECADDTEAINVLTELLGWIYFSTTAKASSPNRLIEIANQSADAEEVVLQKINWLHSQHRFTLLPLHAFLQSRTTISTRLLEIYEWLLVNKGSDGKYSLNDAGASEIIGKCVEALINSDKSSMLVRLFEAWVKDERVKEILTKAVSARDKSVISSLPQAVQATAYTYISEGDNIFDYEDDFEIIAAMNKQDKTGFNKQIEKLVLHKLTKDESFMDGIELLEQLESFKGMKVPHIRSLLEDKENDPENGEQIKACVAKLVKS